MKAHGAKVVGQDVYDLWRDWHALDFEGCPDRDSTSIRVCDYKIQAAVKWAKEVASRGEGGIIWVMHQEIGVWCYEELVKAGIPATHCPAGDQYNKLLTAEDQPLAKTINVCSTTAHGTGKNLQYFQNTYHLQWPRSDILAEQCLGRTHRQGQKADELVVTLNTTNEFDQLNFAACLIDSLYIHQTTGNVQKLIYCTYNPRPKIFPPSVVHQRGLENRILTRDQEEMLKERFDK
jgi:superfamily II DNA helicase RecQ